MFPRISNVDVSDPFFDPTNQSALQVSGSISAATSEVPFILSLGLTVNVSIDSQSYIDYGINSIEFEGFMIDPLTGERILNQSGSSIAGRLEDATVSRMANSTLVIPLQLTFETADPNGIITNANLALFERACGGASQAIMVEYAVKVSIAFISDFGYSPSFTGRSNFDCPISEQEYNDALNGSVNLIGL